MDEFSQSGTISISRDAFADLKHVKDEFDAIIESIDLLSDEKFMKSHNKAKEQIRRRDFDDWDALKDSPDKRVLEEV